MIDPAVLLIAAEVPSLPLAPSPTPPLKVLPAPLPHAPSDAASRYFWKLSVVPDSSLRKTTLILSPGRVLPELSAVISGSFQVVTAPLKILASGRSVESHAVDAGKVVGDRDRSEHRRQVPRVGAAAARLGLVDLTLLGVQGRIGATEIGLPADEFGDARTGAAGCVVEGETRARRLVGGHEPGDGVGLRGRATRLERLLATAVDSRTRCPPQFQRRPSLLRCWSCSRRCRRPKAAGHPQQECSPLHRFDCASRSSFDCEGRRI